MTLENLKNHSKIQFFSNQDEWVRMVVKNIDQLQSQFGVIRVALSGGTTPVPIYRELTKIDLSSIDFFQVDERYVPKAHVHSNHHLIQTHLLNQNPARSFQFFDTSLSIPDCLNQYENQLKKIKIPLFHLCLLGLGPDGHTASLFPKDSLSTTIDRWAVHTQTDLFDVKDRLSLSFSALMESQSIIMLVKGLDKHSIVSRLLNSQIAQEEMPVKKLLRHANFKIYFLEEN